MPGPAVAGHGEARHQPQGVAQRGDLPGVELLARDHGDAVAEQRQRRVDLRRGDGQRLPHRAHGQPQLQFGVRHDQPGRRDAKPGAQAMHLHGGAGRQSVDGERARGVGHRRERRRGGARHRDLRAGDGSAVGVRRTRPRRVSASARGRGQQDERDGQRRAARTRRGYEREGMPSKTTAYEGMPSGPPRRSPRRTAPGERGEGRGPVEEVS